MAIKSDRCALCGKPIEQRPTNPDDALGVDHLPPKLFYPKAMRGGLNLWTVPTHKHCNAAYKLDEEYFSVRLAPLVGNANSETAPAFFGDLRRRAREPQTPVLLRSLLASRETVTPGGIYLPESVVRLTADRGRIQRVAVKIGREVFFRHYQRYMPQENCRDIRLCEGPEDAPEMYQLSWQAGDEIAVCPEVFLYRMVTFDNMHVMSLLFWQAFMFCMTFDDPGPVALNVSGCVTTTFKDTGPNGSSPTSLTES